MAIKYSCRAQASDAVRDAMSQGRALTRAEYRAMLTPKGSYPKDATMAYWVGLPERVNPLESMRPIPNKSTGSSYGACGVRIDGSPEFIDAVLGRLKDLIDGENARTRLELARSRVDGSSLGKAFDKAVPGSEVCYIRLHERGLEAQMMNAMFGGM